MRLLVLIMLKLKGYVKVFEVGDKNYKLMSFYIDDEKPLQKT